MGICLRVLKESNKSRFDSNSVRNSVLNISHITFRDCCVHIFSDNFSRNSCILRPQDGKLITLIKRMTNNPYVSCLKSRHCMVECLCYYTNSICKSISISNGCITFRIRYFRFNGFSWIHISLVH